MKNFKKVVFGLLAMLVMVTSVRAANFTGTNEADLRTCLETASGTAVCTINGDVTLTDHVTINPETNVTLNIRNGATLTSTGVNITVKGTLNINGGKIVADNNGAVIGVSAGATLNIKGTEISTSKAAQVINVVGANAAAWQEDQTMTTVNIDGTVNNTKGKGLNLATGDYATINVSGTWKTKDEAVAIAAAHAVVTVNGDFTAKNNALYLAAGEMTIEGGNYVAGVNGLVVVGGKATVKGADTTFEVNTGNAVYAASPAEVVLENGTYTSEQSSAISLPATSKVLDGYYKGVNGSAAYVMGDILFGGRYQMTEATVNTNLPGYVRAANKEAGLTAVAIGDVIYIGKTYELTIEVTEENGKATYYRSPVELLAGHEYSLEDLVTVEAAEGYAAKYVLNGEEVEGSFVMPEKDSELEVSFVVPSENEPAANEPAVVEPEKNPENNGEPATDEQTNTNPSTFDGIASIVTMAISSVSAAGYSIKKIVRR